MSNQDSPWIVALTNSKASMTRHVENVLERCALDNACLCGKQCRIGFQPVWTLKYHTLTRLVLVVICLTGLRILERGQCQDAANYRLAPNDLLDVRVYDEPDLAAEVRLAGDGTAIFPLIGSVALRGKTIPQATALIRERYMAGYLVNPQVSLIIQAYAKRTFTMLGQVQKPGSYEIVGDETISLLQAVGMAGGYTRIADPGNITVRRGDGGKEQVMRFNGRRMAKGDSSPDCVVKSGDVITVGESIF
jgi:polysaccharide export outer membrane protein